MSTDLLNADCENRNVRGDLGAIMTELSNYNFLKIDDSCGEWFGYNEEEGNVWIALECPKAFKDCHSFCIFMDSSGDIKYTITTDDGTELIDGAYDDLYKAYDATLHYEIEEDDVEKLKKLIEKYGIDALKTAVDYAEEKINKF